MSSTQGPPYAARVPAWLVWNGHRLPLSRGDNTLGRDGSCDVFFDAATVSRRHALIVVTDAGATLEDLGSHNGTFLNGAIVTTAEQLADGDEIRLGSVPVIYRVGTAEGLTETLVPDTETTELS
jgi:pSer/pThr/pTyr-binding forkhead associated (FHA) protein